MKTNIIIVFILLAGQTWGQAKPKPIFFYKPYTNSTETNLYGDTIPKFDFLIQYENIKNADVEKDVENAILNKDYRIVGLSGFSYIYPGLEDGYKTNKDGTKIFIGLDPKYEKYIKKYSFKVIRGTSDDFDTGKPYLQKIAYEYAKNYNLLLLDKMKERM